MESCAEGTIQPVDKPRREGVAYQLKFPRAGLIFSTVLRKTDWSGSLDSSPLVGMYNH